MKNKIVFFLLALFSAGSLFAEDSKTLDELNIRDPFIYADAKAKTYYLYFASDTTIDGQIRGGVSVWKSKDLIRWGNRQRVFVCPKNNYLIGGVWAPEMHTYKGKFYLFLTLNSNVKWKADQQGLPAFTHRTVQVMEANSPLGPFKPISFLPTTPIDQMALDGTFWVENGRPFMVYCNEWVQRYDGTYRLAPLTQDLSRTVDDGHDLFCASAAPWVVPIGTSNGQKTYVSDGCFIYKTKKKLLMLMSSFCKDGYTVGVAESLSGSIYGPWNVQQKPLINIEGGHAMIFKDFKGQAWLVLHSPNSPAGKEHSKLLKVRETDNGDIIVQ